MTSDEKAKVRKMKIEGKSYFQIAEELKVSENTIKSFCRRNNLQDTQATKEKFTHCQNCKKELDLIEKQKPKKFCCEDCRLQWWSKNRDKLKKRAIYDLKCKFCEKTFESYGNQKRKYCGHECYIKSRFEK